jgi:anhydro-N-acetylmuramic acid kinase
MNSPPRRVVGCMTGTSIDGIDAALLEITGHGLEAMRCTFVRGASASLGPLRQPLRDLAEQRPMTAGAIAALARDFALLHAQVVTDLLGSERCDLICVHGQTVFHQPPLSWQLFEPAPLVHALRCPVVCNLRKADLARGGQGAPITPIADSVLFRHANVQAIINLGGFCNVTQFGSHEARTRGKDVCACNHLLDFIARTRLGAPFDEQGNAASQGRVDAPLSRELCLALRAQGAARRSLGTGDELSTLIDRIAPGLSPQDLAATTCDAIAWCVREALPTDVDRVMVAGGGVRNRALMHALARRFGRCETTHSAGIPPEFREAACFAVLGALTQDGCSIYEPPGPLAGNWAYPEVKA